MIHVMEAGRIVESGKHDELLSRGGMYARSWAAQLQGDTPGGAQPLAADIGSLRTQHSDTRMSLFY
jgi:hypothetical protein